MAWDERGIAFPRMDQNERTAVSGIFSAISKSMFFFTFFFFFFCQCHRRLSTVYIRVMSFFVGVKHNQQTGWTQLFFAVKPSFLAQVDIS